MPKIRHKKHIINPNKIKINAEEFQKNSNIQNTKNTKNGKYTKKCLTIKKRI